LAVPHKEVYTNIEMMHFLEEVESKERKRHWDQVLDTLLKGDKETMKSTLYAINEALQEKGAIKNRKSDLKQELQLRIQFLKEREEDEISRRLYSQFLKPTALWDQIQAIRKDNASIQTFMREVQPTLDKYVYGHKKAKRQIERILAQWINSDGAFFNEGHVLGLEGNPGIGKTTLAKGLSHCLVDEEGNPRPLAIIAMGGSSNASTLVGHSYTYVGSTWGEIVQILMDKKCMNPIILIDEIDKISKTENGKEIIGILTHLLDSTQNNAFQDKYFSGIELDLSKVLFVLSYNDASLVDRILLDRIHRIHFDSLTLEDKMVISKKYLLVEIYKKTGLQDIVHFEDDALKCVIEDHTMESGVRKLKEKLFDIVSEINLEYIQEKKDRIQIPIVVTREDIEKKYLKENKEIRIQKIHKEDRVGTINCLWANSYNIGGILSATACFIPASRFLDLKLTGLMDKMMEESFQVSLSNAYMLLDEATQEALQEKHKGQGIHMHMGDGSVEKSGTSAGMAITILLYSLFTQKKIRHDFAVTGEANDLNGKIGEIGALKTKILYGIKAGVKHFIYPSENKKDFELFMEKNRENPVLEDIQFYDVENVKEALSLILVE
jgi:ATP-dependent Lon protease